MKNILLLENDTIQAKHLIDIIREYSSKIQVFHATGIAQAETLIKNIAFDAYFVDTCLGNQKENQDGLDWVCSLLPPPRQNITYVSMYPSYALSQTFRIASGGL